MLGWDKLTTKLSGSEQVQAELAPYSLLHVSEMINVKTLKTLARNEISLTPRRGKEKYKQKKCKFQEISPAGWSSLIT